MRFRFPQSGMSESTSDIVEIQDVAIEDMKVIINFIYGVLEATPDSDEWLHSLTLAIDRLGLQVTVLLLWWLFKIRVARRHLERVAHVYLFQEIQNYVHRRMASWSIVSPD